MILNELNDINLEDFPVIIFGSGPAGITTALELEEKNIKSIIIEAGEENYSESSQILYKGETYGDPITDLSTSRLRQFGGTSGHWGGWSKPIVDYNLRDWPLNINDLKPYKKKTAKILDIKNQFRELEINQYFDQIEFQYSNVRFADKYREHIKKSEKILLILNTQLSHFVGNNSKIQYAECISKNIKRKIFSKYFILSCGGIENSRLLLWTKQKNRNLFDNEMPIGKYWMNHPWILGGAGLINKDKLKKKFGVNFLEYDGPIHFSVKEKFINDTKNLSAGIYMDANEDKNFFKEIVKDILCIAPEYGRKIAGKVFNKSLKCGNIFMHLEEEPNVNNKIVLSEKKDKFEIPLVKLYYKKSPKSLSSAKNILEEFANLCRKENFGRIAIDEKIFNLEKFESMGAWHHMGGTRAGISKQISVVDKNLKVHDIENIYINGSSNFTTGGYSNPTFTIIQLAIRLADKIKERLYS